MSSCDFCGLKAFDIGVYIFLVLRGVLAPIEAEDRIPFPFFNVYFDKL